MNAFFFFHRKTMTSGATMMMMIAVADDIRTKCNSIWTAAAEQKRHFLLPFILNSIFGSGQFLLCSIVH